MSDAAAALAAPITVSHKGKEYQLSPLNLDMIAMFERWLENRAYEVIEIRKGAVARDDYECMLHGWVADCAAGRYRWGRTTAQQSSRSVEGLKFLNFLMLAEKNPSMNQKLAAEIFDAQLAEIQAKMEVVNAGPFDATTSLATPTNP
jgi:hypothetical protein